MATQITELQKIGKRFAHLKLRDSFRSNISSVTAKSNCSSSAGSPYAGNSASARPSIISYKAPSKQADKSSISPSQLLGKNYLQWLTLCLVMLISICLIAMLALYITSKSDPDNDKISSTADLALGADTFPISFDANTANNQTFVGFPPILVQDGSEVWDNLWSTGHCKFVAPVALDPQCVSNATYAQSHCISWDFMDCCVDLGQSISKPTEEQLPGYHTENAALSQNLHVSFEKEFDARGDPSNIGKVCDLSSCCCVQLYLFARLRVEHSDRPIFKWTMRLNGGSTIGFNTSLTFRISVKHKVTRIGRKRLSLLLNPMAHRNLQNCGNETAWTLW